MAKTLAMCGELDIEIEFVFLWFAKDIVQISYKEADNCIE